MASRPYLVMYWDGCKQRRDAGKILAFWGMVVWMFFQPTQVEVLMTVASYVLYCLWWQHKDKRPSYVCVYITSSYIKAYEYKCIDHPL